jgi:aryl-alcohol dehydrogenase-like predicted oxidoreductase
LQKNGQRDQFVVATKFTVPYGQGPNQCGASRKNILFSVEGSLSRLKTDYIDLYYVHCWDSGTPLEETLSTLNDLVRLGKVRYIGCSNFAGWQLQKAIDISKYMGLEAFVALQQQYGLLERWSELELFPVCQNEGVAFLPWGPLKGGWLTGRYKRGDKPAEPTSSRVAAAEQNGWAPTSWSGNDNEHTWNVLDAVKEISKQTGKSMAAVSLRWVLQRPGIPSVLIGARTLEQLEDNMTATTFTLSKEQMEYLTKVSTRFTPYPYDFIAMFNTWRQRPSSK